MSVKDHYDLAVVGLGYVGLPLARSAARRGLKVVGLDLDGEVVSGLNDGRSHIDDLNDDDIAQMLANDFVASADPDVLGRAKSVAICVPTPLSEDGVPDLNAVESATRSIAGRLQAGAAVILESTTYPGTTDEVLRPILESTGMVAGTDFYLAFSPERIDPGNPTYTIENTPKVVGGHTEKCTEVVASFYRRFLDEVVETSGTREAEMTKLLENTYRHINIALVNEMVQFCHEMKIDFWEVMRNAATKPFGFQSFKPSAGVGGHCIPIDPNYLAYRVRATLDRPFQFVELAQAVNRQMPRYVVSRVTDLLNEKGKPVLGSRVLLLGVTYKPNIADQRESPADPVGRLLLAKGAELSFHDPLVGSWILDGAGVPGVSQDGLLEAASQADLVVVLQAHHAFDMASIADAAQLFFDTTGTTTSPDVARL